MWRFLKRILGGDEGRCRCASGAHAATPPLDPMVYARRASNAWLGDLKIPTRSHVEGQRRSRVLTCPLPTEFEIHSAPIMRDAVM
jgi:hypothetical protein